MENEGIENFICEDCQKKFPTKFLYEVECEARDGIQVESYDRKVCPHCFFDDGKGGGYVYDKMPKELETKLRNLNATEVQK